MCLPPERLSPAAASSSRSSTPSSDLRGRLSPQLAEALAAVEDATDDLLPDLSEQCARAVAPAGEEDVFLELRWHEEDSSPVLPSSPFKDLPATPQLDHVVLALFATQDVFLQDDAATAPEEAIPSAFDAIRGALAAAGSPPGLCARAHALAKLYDNMQAAPPDDKMQAALLDQLSLLFLDATERAVEAPPPAPGPADPPLEARLRHDGWCREFTRWLCAVPREQRRRFVAAIDGRQAVERAAAAEQAARTRRGDASAQPKGALPRLQQALWRALRGELARLEVLLLSRVRRASHPDPRCPPPPPAPHRTSSSTAQDFLCLAAASFIIRGSHAFSALLRDGAACRGDEHAQLRRAPGGELAAARRRPAAVPPRAHKSASR